LFVSVIALLFRFSIEQLYWNLYFGTLISISFNMADKKGVSFNEPEKKEGKESVEVEDTKEREHRTNIESCRMYEQKYPEVDDLVMVEVKSIEEMGAYVALKEYNDIEGMILLSELSRRRIRSINKIIRVGRSEVVLVLRVDKEKGYIDLSKRRVTDDDVLKCTEKYNNSKDVHNIMRHIADTAQTQGLPDSSLEELYQKIAWPLYRKYGHAYEGFKTAMTDPKVLDELNLGEELLEVVVKNIKRRLTPQPIKMRADLEVTCFHYEGIDAIRASLKKGEETSTELAPISVKLVAPPLYVVVTSSINKDVGINALNVAIEAIKTEIAKYKGEIIVKAPPRAVHEKDERELEKEMEKLARENAEVPADDDGSAGEEEGEGEDD